MTIQSLPVGILGSVGGAPAYDPGMMTFDGATGFYSKTGITTSGNKVTAVMRFNMAPFAGGVAQWIMNLEGGAGTRIRVIAGVYSSDHASTNRRNKLVFLVQNSAGATICLLLSDVDVNDGADKFAFMDFDGDGGTGRLYIDGADADDTGNADRVAPTTGTLETGAAGVISVGSIDHTAWSGGVDGDVGYVGYRDTAGLTPSDFYSSGVQELDESGWTEWGAQPLFWNQFGTMTDNKGSAGNMTKTGTITGPA